MSKFFNRKYAALIVALVVAAIIVSAPAGVLAAGGPFEEAVTVLDKESGGTGLYLDKGLGKERLESGDMVSLEDVFDLQYHFEIETSQIFDILDNPEKTYAIPAPDKLVWAGDTPYPFIVNVEYDHVTYKVAEVEITGGAAFITFTGGFWDLDLEDSYIEFAYFELPCRLSDEVASAQPETVDMALLGGEDLMLYVFEFQKSKHDIEKAGSWANGLFTWEITYIPGAEDTEYPVRLVDSFNNNEQVIVPGSLQIQRNGQEPAGAVAHLPGETSISLEIEDYSPDPVTLTYQTRLADAELDGALMNQDSVVSNSVVLLDDSETVIAGPVSEEVDVKREDKVWSQKTGSQSGRTISWSVVVHTLGRDLDNLVISDDIPAGLVLSGGPTITDLDTNLPASAEISSDLNGYSIEVDAPYSTNGYRLNFTTVADENYFDGSIPDTFTNKADVDFEWNKYNLDGTPGDPVQTQRPATYTVVLDSKLVHKSGTYNRGTGEITWTVQVNRYKADVLEGTITDDLTGRGQTYVPGSFSSGDPGIVLDSVNSGDKLVIVDVGNIGANSYSFTFKAKIDDPEIYAGNFAYDINGALTWMYYYNDVSFDGYIQTEDGVLHVTSSNTGSATVTSRMLDKAPAGYAYDTHLATWAVTVNRNNMALTNLVLTDNVATGQSFVPGSVLIDGAAPGLDVNVDYGGDTLVIEIPAVSAQTAITYQTKIDPGLIDDFKTELAAEISNEATLSFDGAPELRQTASQTISNNLVDKTGAFDSGNKVISYSVCINPNGVSIDNGTVSDRIPDGLQLDITSVKLVGATINPDGSFSEGALYYGYEDAAFTYTTKGFSLELPAGSAPYILKYDCYITNANLRPFLNDVRLNDDSGIEGDTAESEDEIDVGNSGTGTSSKRVKLNVEKVDAVRPGVKLDGISLELYQKIGLSEVLIMEGTTDSSGKAEFYPLAQGGTYILRELPYEEDGTQGKPGYNTDTINADNTADIDIIEKNGADLGFTVLKAGGETDLTVTNVPHTGSIQFTKTTDRAAKGVFLPTGAGEAKFRITDTTPGSDFSMEAETDASGVVLFEDVPPFGLYKVEEITTPLYHTTAAPFFVEIDADSNTLDGWGYGGTNTVENVYFRPDFVITKTGADGAAPIPGVTFELCDGDGDSFSTPWTETTDAAGKAVFVDLYGGDSYVIRELGSPLPGYYETGDYEVGLVNQAEDYALTWKNYEYAASLELTKVDEMRTGVLLDGAEFALYRDDGTGTGPDLVGGPLATQATSGAAGAGYGKTVFAGLGLDQDLAALALSVNAEPALLSTVYWLVETVAPDGYILDPAPVKVTLDPAKGGAAPRTYMYKATVENEPVKHGTVSLTFTKNSNKEAPYTLGAGALGDMAFELVDQTGGSDLVREATSDASGIVEFDNIPFGTYRVHEVAAALYHKALADFFVTFDKNGICTSFNGISDPEAGDFVITNEIYDPDFVITKTGSDGATPIPGAVFELCDEDGDSFSTPIYATTDAVGKATFVGLLGGDTYTIKETSTPLPGYYTTGEYKVGPVNQTGDYSLTWRNYEHAASIEVTKVDEMRKGVLLGGAEFELYRDDGTGTAPDLVGGPVATQTTSGAAGAGYGKTVFAGLELNQDLAPLSLSVNSEPALLSTIYWLVETAVPDGYILDPAPVKVTLTTRSQAAKVTIENEPVTADITFTKFTDRDAGAKIAGATFKATDQTPGSDYTQTADETDEDGIVSFTGLPFGRYTVEETGAPAYHTKASNFEFEIDTNGDCIEFNGVVGPSGSDFGITDNIKKTNLTITKQSAGGGAHAGVWFDLYRLVSSVETWVGESQTDAGGVALFSGLLMGGESYVVKERGTPLSGYYKTGEYSVAVTQSGAATNPATALTPYSCAWTNYPYAASIEVTKVDEMRKGVLLGGAEFELYRDDGTGTAPDLVGGPVATQTTSGAAGAGYGKAVFAGLELDQDLAALSLSVNSEPVLSSTAYWLVETVAPDGYILDPAPVKVTLEPSGKPNPRTHTYTITIENEPTQHGSVSLIFTKNSDKAAPYTPGASALEDMAFELIDLTGGSDLVREATSDASGMVEFDDIPFGTYRVHEVAAALYHKTLADFFVTFDDNGVCTSFNGTENPEPGDFVITNKIYNPDFVITKTKADGTTPIPGAMFELCDVDGDSFSTPIYATTDAGGKATLTGLLGGDTYIIKETNTPLPGYYRSGEYEVGPVNQAGNYSFTWRNYEYAASIEVTKVDEKRKGVLLGGAEFELYRDDGTGLGPDLVGGPVATQTTSSAPGAGYGKTVFDGLELDQDLAALSLSVNSEPVLSSTIYWLVETVAPGGYILDPDPVRVELTTRCQAAKVTIENEPKTGTIEFTKFTDRDAGTALAGAKFEITDLTPGSEYTQEAVSDEDGVVSFVAVPFGEYLAEEIETPDYHNAVEPFLITLDKDCNCTKFGDLEDEEGLVGPFSVTDTIKKTSLTITKQRADGLALSGLWFDLYRVVDGEETSEELLAGSAQTNAGGVAVFSGLLMGGESYVVKERGTMTGYYTTGEYSLAVIQSGAAANPATPLTPYTYTWTNYPYAASIEISKVDEVYPEAPVEGVVFELYRSNTAGTEPDGEAIAVSDPTGSFGKILFTGLDLTQTGTLTTDSEPTLEPTVYWLVETEAPDGYILDGTAVKVTLTTRTEAAKITIDNEPEFVDITYTTYNRNEADSNAGGYLSPSSPYPYKEHITAVVGESSGCTAVASPGYHFVGWYELGADCSNNAEIFSSAVKLVPARDTESGLNFTAAYVAVFEENADVTINYSRATVDSDGETPQTASNGGTISKTSDVVAPATGEPSVTATAKAGYEFVGWYNAGDTGFTTGLESGVTFTPPVDSNGLNVTGSYVALFKELADVTINYAPRTVASDGATAQSPAGRGGSVSPMTDIVAPATGEPSSKATANPGYEFVGWYDASDTAYAENLSSSLTFTPPADSNGLNVAGSYVALFKELADVTITYAPRTVASDGTTAQSPDSRGGSVSPATDIVAPATGEPSSKATANPGYEFVGWYDAGDTAYADKLGSSQTFTPPTDSNGLNVTGSYVALFKELSDVTINYAPRTVASDGTTAQSPDSLGGSVSPTTDIVAPATGEPSSEATANPGYEFIGWYDASDTGFTTKLGISATFTPPADSNGLNVAGSYVALFKELADVTINYAPRTVASDGATAQSPDSLGGSVSLTTDIVAPATGEPSSEATANPGYEFVGWYDASDTAYADKLGSSLTFTPPADSNGLNVTGSYVALFKELAYVTINYAPRTVASDGVTAQSPNNRGGSVSPATDIVAPATGEPSSEATANPGYEFVGWYDAGDTAYAENLGSSLTFTPPADSNGLNVTGSYVVLFKELADVTINYAPRTVASDGATAQSPDSLGGSVSPTNNILAPATGAPSSKATANPGYEFVGWYDAGDTAYADKLSSSQTFTPPTDSNGLNVTGNYVALFKELSDVTINYAPRTVASDGATAQSPDSLGGSVSPMTDIVAPATGEPSSEATANPGYEFIGWYDASDTAYAENLGSSLTFTPPADSNGLNVTGSYVALFKELADVTINYAPMTVASDGATAQSPAGRGGSVSPATNIVAPATGEPSSKATANPGYEFVGWYDASDTAYAKNLSSSQTFTPLTDSNGLNVTGSYVALFKELSDITINYAPKTVASDGTTAQTDSLGGSVSPTTDIVAPATGEPSSEATANPGYEFVGWYDAGDTSYADKLGSSLTFTPPADSNGLNIAGSYVALFKELADVTINYAPRTVASDGATAQSPNTRGGSVSPMTDIVAPATGEPSSEATANPGYEFVGWYDAGDTAYADKLGSSLAFTPPADSNGLNVTGSYVALFKELADVTINYAPRTVASDGATAQSPDSLGGSVSPATDIVAPAMGEPSSEATANPGYEFVGWYDAGDAAYADKLGSSLTFTPPADSNGLNVTGSYVALFKELDDITINYAPRTVASDGTTAQSPDSLGGSVSPATDIVAPATGEPSSKATANPGYEFIGWYDASDTAYAENLGLSLTFTPPADSNGLNVAGSYVALFKELADVTINYAPRTVASDGTTAQSPAGRGGSVSPATDIVAPATGEPSSKATANPGYEFVGWYDASDTAYAENLSSSQTFMPPADSNGLNVAGSYVALFKELSDVTINYAPRTVASDGTTAQSPDSLGGSVSPATDIVAPATGEPSSEATANPGYEFVGWYDAGDTSYADKLGSSLTFTPPADSNGLNVTGSYVALFNELADVTITFGTKTFGSSWDPLADSLGGSVTPGGGQSYAPATGSPGSTASANAGYAFLGWFKPDDDFENDAPITTDEAFEPEKVDGLNHEASYVAVFKEGATVTINYEAYNLNTADPNPGGAISRTSQTLAPASGVALSSIATAGSGYLFVGWFVSGANYAVDTPLTTGAVFTPSKTSGVYEAKTYVAVFAENADVSITYSATEGGSVSLAAEDLAPATGVANGSTATANAGYYLVGWYDANDTEFDVLFSDDEHFVPALAGGLNVAGNYIARFTESDNITIKYIATPGGDVSRTTDVVAPATGTPLGSEAIAAPGYHFTGWYANGAKVSDEDNFVPEKTGGAYTTGTFIAMFTEDLPVSAGYKVEHYLVDASNNATLCETEVLAGLIGEAAEAEPKTGYTGYTWQNGAPGEVKTGIIIENGGLTLKLYYSINKHTVNYVVEGLIPPGATASLPALPDVAYGATQSLAGEPAFPGYTFSGWHSVDCMVKSDNTFLMPDSDVKFTGSWIPDSTPAIADYKVEHYLVDASTNVSLYETEDLKGEIGTIAAAAPKAGYAGFTCQPGFAGGITSGVIEADGSLVLKLYYTVNENLVSYVIVGYEPPGAPSVPAAASAPYGSTQTVADDPVFSGYVFTRWSTADCAVNGDGTFSMPDGPVTFFGGWVPDDGDLAEYTVQHYLEGVLFETETLIGIAGEPASAISKSYPGYTCVSGAASGTIEADGSLVLELYYTLNEHTITYSFAGIVPAGAELLLPATEPGAPCGSARIVEAEPVFAGYIFSGWQTVSCMVKSDNSFDMPDNDVSFTGSWVMDAPKTVAGYTVEHYLEGAASPYETEALKGVSGAIASAEPKTGYAGYDYDAGAANVMSGAITGDGSLTLILYYALARHEVRYEISGDIPPGISAPGPAAGVPFGETVIIEGNPFYAGYTFSGWRTPDCMTANGEFVMPDRDVVFSGVWTRNPVMLTVLFVNWDGTLLKTEYVPYGWDATAPASPSRSGGYSFTGWDKPYANITENITVMALYSKTHKQEIDPGAGTEAGPGATPGVGAEAGPGATPGAGQGGNAGGGRGANAGGIIRTGDYSNMMLWLIMLLASGLGIPCLLIWRKRRKPGGFADK